jgi:hypothetical protein
VKIDELYSYAVSKYVAGGSWDIIDILCRYLVSKHGGLKKKIDPFFSDFLVCSDSLAKCCIQAKGLMRNRTEKSERGELRRGRVEEHFLTSAHTKMLFHSPSSFRFLGAVSH